MILDHPIRRSLLIAAIYLLAAVVLNELLQRHVVSAETVMRLMGMLMGSVVFVSANAIPKRLVPLARLSCDPAREQTLRRFGGRVLVLGGLGYTLAFVLAPAVLVVAGIKARCAWMRRSARRGGA